MDCSQKLTCKDFKNYSEAARYFHQCHAKKLDGDGDNIPCNSLYDKMRKHR
ncbi:MAG: excalibur calcium-binding domain-containing protein [Haemophilus parahaemolyticus]|nr:excalibur calcium-binding domain-containing protein [Haemophilus parahaemolyticus]MDQ6575635.1 excalibur calcium-binding domain-containing protein [Haemophilus parahaemolyticus]